MKTTDGLLLLAILELIIFALNIPASIDGYVVNQVACVVAFVGFLFLMYLSFKEI